MLTVKLIPGTLLDKPATTQKMSEAGFSINYAKYPESVEITLILKDKYKTEIDAVSKMCDCFVEVVGR